MLEFRYSQSCKGRNMTTYFISDTHFGHAHIIDLCGRPWGTVEAMDRDLIGLWNARVGPDDHVYHLGDFSYRNATSPKTYLRKLNGRKHLIIGNHDYKSLLKTPDVASCFESIDSALSITAPDGRRAFLCHYPLADPPKHVWSLYGHVHNNREWPGFELVRDQPLSLNCCADINGYMPVTLEELIANNEQWRKG